MGCGKVTRGRIGYGETAENKTITCSLNKIESLLGISIPNESIIKILDSLEINAEIENGTITCVVPPYRDDITRDCDIVEELIRVYGYDNISGTLLENSQITCGGKSRNQQGR